MNSPVRPRLASVVLATMCFAAGCGSSMSEDDLNEPPIGPAVVERYTGVEYEPADVLACGDTIVIGEAIYFPMPVSAVEDIDREWYHASADPTGSAVPAPDDAGNGGEPGVLVTFADGVAEFIADSGDITWFTLVEPEYEPGTEPDC